VSDILLLVLSWWVWIGCGQWVMSALRLLQWFVDSRAVCLL